MNGILYGIGTGPGDPELLTIKAVKLIQKADCIAIPSEHTEDCLSYATALAAVPEIAGKEIIFTPFPMVKDRNILEKIHHQNACKIKDRLKNGKNVAFLTIGDPTVYSTYGYLHQILINEGFHAEIINGITSFCAAASSLGQILCEGSQKLEIIPASYHNENDGKVNEPPTRVYMKSARNYSTLLRALRARGSRTMMAENCTQQNEKIYNTIEEFPKDTGYFSIIIEKETKEKD